VAVNGVIIGAGLDVIVATSKGLVWKCGGKIMKYMAIAMACLALIGCGTLNMRHSCVSMLEDMVLIPAGTNSGTNSLGSGEFYNPGFYPQTYSFTVSAFYMDKYEVTKAQWDEVYVWAIKHGYSFDNAGSGKGPNHPVQTVSWYDVVKWCNARSEMEGKPISYRVGRKVYRTGQIDAVSCATNINGYRLPTDVEWEYAARGGASGRRFPWIDSNTIQHSRANYNSYWAYDPSPTRGYHPAYTNGAMPYTSPVGSFAPNGYGLYDMVGNVDEWCWDWYPGYEGSSRVYRGGGWNSYAYNCRIAARLLVTPHYTDDSLGFRVVLPPGPTAAP